MILVVEASDELVRLIAHAVEELVELFVGDAGQDGRVGDLVAVEVQDRLASIPSVRGLMSLLDCQPVASGPVSASPSPTMAGTNRLGLFITAAVGVGQGVTQLAAFVDGARGFRSVVGRDATRVGELAEELLQTSFVLG